jgi:hypothetical protein
MISANPKECWCGKSTDTKPTEGVPNGQGIIEIDTGDYYKFDLDTKTWIKQ